MTALFPNDRPTLLPAIIDGKVETELGEGAHKYVLLVGVRGYRLNSMGRVGKTTAAFMTTLFLLNRRIVLNRLPAIQIQHHSAKAKAKAQKKAWLY